MESAFYEKADFNISKEIFLKIHFVISIRGIFRQLKGAN